MTFSIETFSTLTWLTDIDTDCGGIRAAVAKRRIRGDDEGYDGWIAIVDVQTGEEIPVTGCGEYAHLPRFSPDGEKLAYASDSDGWGVWTYEDGVSRLILDVPGGVRDISWSPDGRRLAVVTRCAVDNDALVDERAGQIPEVDVVRRLHYKTDSSGYWDGQWSQVLVISLCGDKVQVSQVTDGPYDHEDARWSPCGAMLTFAANRTGRADWSQDRSVWVAQESSDGWYLKELGSAGGPARSPCWSPDGKWIAFLGHDRRAEAATNWDIWLLNAQEGGDPVCLTGSFDRSLEDSVSGDALSGVPPFAPAWDPDGKGIWFLATDGPSTHLFFVDFEEALARSTDAVEPPPARGVSDEDVTEGTPIRRVLAGRRHIYRFSFCGDFSSVAFLASDEVTPCDAWVARDRVETRVTRVNRDCIARDSLAEPEHMVFQVERGVKVEGWLMRPPDSGDADVEYPVIAHLHRGRFGHSFRHEFQIMAGAGYAVFYLNCRGGYGYGQKFREAIHYRPMTSEVHDIVFALNEVCGRPDIDENRVGATGQSYGGHLTNWLLATTDIFSAGVSRASISNLYSEWGSNDKGYLRWEAVGPPWQKQEFYLESSPMTHVEGVTAPILIMHADEDYRCSLEQAEQFYTALKYLDRTAEMVIFRGENHELVRSGRPRLRYEQLRRIIAWFDRYL